MFLGQKHIVLIDNTPWMAVLASESTKTNCDHLFSQSQLNRSCISKAFHLPPKIRYLQIVTFKGPSTAITRMNLRMNGPQLTHDYTTKRSNTSDITWLAQLQQNAVLATSFDQNRTWMPLDLAVTDKPFSCRILWQRKSQKRNKWPNQKIPDYPQVWHSGHMRQHQQPSTNSITQWSVSNEDP